MNTLVNYIRLCRDYKSRPNLRGYSLRELGMIWLYTACMADEFQLPPIVPEKQFDEIGNYLLENWHKLPTQLRCCIPLISLTTSTPAGVSWNRDLAIHIRQDVEKYNKIRHREIITDVNPIMACC